MPEDSKVPEKAPPDPIVLRYVKGSYVPGIPARDLTVADVAALPDAELAALAETPTYRGLSGWEKLQSDRPGLAKAIAARLPDAAPPPAETSPPPTQPPTPPAGPAAPPKETP